jgi:hypothetical protein
LRLYNKHPKLYYLLVTKPSTFYITHQERAYKKKTRTDQEVPSVQQEGFHPRNAVYVLVGNRQELGELAEPRCGQVRMAVQTAGTARSLELSDVYGEQDDTAATKEFTFVTSSMGWSAVAELEGTSRCPGPPYGIAKYEENFI